MTHPQNDVPDAAPYPPAPQQAFSPQAPQYVPHQPGGPDPAFPAQQPPYVGGPGAPVPATRTNGVAIAALVVGALSVFFSWVPVAGVLGGVVAVVLGVVGLRKASGGVDGRGLALGGVVAGALALLIGAVVTIITFVAISRADATFEQLEQSQQEAQDALDQAVEEEPLVEDESVEVVDEPVDEPVEEPVDDPGVTEAEGRLDFSHVTCDLVGEEAVAISAANADVTTPISTVTETVLLADHRADYPVPTGTEEAVVMTCGGTATFGDGTTAYIAMDLSVDGAGTSYVFYTTE